MLGLADGVHQGIHHSIKYDDGEGDPTDTNLDRKWLAVPLLSANNPDKTLVHAGHCIYHAGGGVVVLQSKSN